MLNLSRVNRAFLYRQWKYWQLGYGLFLTKPIAILQFITVMYVLLLERISFLKVFLPHFTYFAVFSFFLLGPLGILLGWFYMRKSKIFGVEAILATESNPLTVHTQRVAMENSLKVLKALKITPAPEWLNLYEYWKHLDKKTKWKP